MKGEMTQKGEHPELHEQINFFAANQTKFAENHHNKFVLVYEGNERGFYETGGEAYRIAKQRKYRSGAFLIRQCVRPGEEKVAIFRTRVHD